MTDTPNRPPLSPTAQAVLDAYWKGDYEPSWTHQLALAAALRAAILQVRTDPNLKRHHAATMAEMLVLDKLLAIAAELEGAA